MTIIERALNKHRPAPTMNGGAKRPRPMTPGRTIDPSLRIPRHKAVVDLKACRERRLLLTVQTDDDKACVASYRMLRTRLLHRARNSNWTTVAVTSAGPNDGKTTTIINLALSMAREKGRDVVLLDLDMRNPSVCRALGVHPKHELRDYLDRGQAFDDLFFTLPGADNLLIAGSVTPTETASELLAGAVFDEMLNHVKRGTADPLILIDLPPILVTDDALVVAPKIDAVLVVASEGSTSRSELEKALQLVSEFTVAGVVLNRASETSADYNYAYEADPGANAS
ncbi:MAG TPA: CpsD/CapB family tyrosine-protein kinase [Steroidobacteraceae bacterium]|jgi:capsular exopolysaccharide synthesis family protein|nr:CpsD/CapB family tyrosine-protein kinase [Steroidobacteraceae bacterium]